MKTKIYIDGQSGTTGLQIYDRIGKRDDLELLRIPEDKRHDTEERKKYLNSADIVFLCLPDDGAREAVSLIDNASVRVIDASTAHRTNDDWVYGFPEISKEQREAIRTGKRIANPGCHATGFISVTAPLVRMGILPVDYPVTCYSLTGYSGGGKKMIQDYEAEGRSELLSAPGIYGLNLKHKHIPEMQKMTGLNHAPVFMPVVDDYYKGMATTIMLQNRFLTGKPTAENICEKLQEYYSDEHFVKVVPFGENDSKLYANRLAGTNKLEIIVCGYEDQTSVTALFDNLGKGASGAAVQNMNIMLGIPEDTGL
ncbi:N-acetyl-gamma-glutamyl-phosphate reductase [Oribacterium sp. C9]|uniref:N-acetyl-gamma-glutamyl-phosphate reductase n=1 Tax=Oribacterium sp. C9 TaxID=1943579 RepID=UPI00098E9592|nr:N-acetyl-gamma-glutamyl-phosphate reductase [Oribacterium sp. C9]OON87998.1 N-acetyl-gamma-glutamyl-phosphate reductase [Oribacterium sp. C9]